MTTIRYPKFYKDAPTLTVWDPLSAFLGAAADGMIEYRYLGAVKLAGHSCPTVAGAYLMAVRALTRLYPGRPPHRGNIEVYFPEAAASGVAGVMARIASLLTGAAQNDGFKGIGGRFDRRNLLFFDIPLQGDVAFRRRDTGAAVAARFDPSVIPSSPQMSSLLARAVSGAADPATLAQFRALWQDRVRRILIDHADRLVQITDWSGPFAATAASQVEPRYY